PLSVCHTSSRHLCFFPLRFRPPPRSTLFPYTTLFRSHEKPGFRCSWFANQTRVLYAPQTPFGKSDILVVPEVYGPAHRPPAPPGDRKSTRLNSSHVSISYAVFCLKKKKTDRRERGQAV